MASGEQTMNTTNADLRSLWLAEYNRPFTGWDMSYLAGRRIMIRPSETWDYSATVIAALGTSHAMLDMDTGGGEFLASLPSRPPLTCATEGYTPNVEVARRRLEPLGVQVYDVAGDAHLPFADGRFDLVTNRHGAYDPREIWRILESGGLFITQQVGSQTNRRLHELLGHTAEPAAPNAGQGRSETWNLAVAVRELKDAGLYILEQREEFPITRYFDVGAIIYYLKAIPWEIPDFSVDAYFPRLLAIHELIRADGYVDIPFHQFFIRARKE
jgi:ubiquinone/menaquinone biosynthesis C-methylase UbiE